MTEPIEKLKEPGLASEFFSDLISRIIPGYAFLFLFNRDYIIGQALISKEWSIAVVAPVVFIAAWAIGTTIDILSYTLGIKLWDWIRPTCNKWRKLLSLPWRMMPARIDFSIPPNDRRNPIKRKIEKEVAESTMYRNLACVFVGAAIWFFKHDVPFGKICAYYILPAGIAGLSFLALRKRGLNMNKIDEQKPTASHTK